MSFVSDFVNREQQLALVGQAIRHETAACLLLIQGTDGIGKTYLLDECQAQCRAQGVPTARVDLAERPSQDYLALARQLWEQLGPDGFSPLDQALAEADTFGQWHAEEFLATPVKPPAWPPSNASVPAQIHAKVGDVGADAQVAIGQQITMIRGAVVNNVTQIIQHDSPWVQQRVEQRITTALRESLSQCTATTTVVLLLDSWEQATTDLRNWLNRNLLLWALEARLGSAAVIVAGKEVPPVTRYPRRAEQLTLSELSADAVRTYWVEKRGLPAEETSEIIKYSGGHPLLLNLLANRRALSLSTHA